MQRKTSSRTTRLLPKCDQNSVFTPRLDECQQTECNPGTMQLFVRHEATAKTLLLQVSGEVSIERLFKQISHLFGQPGTSNMSLMTSEGHTVRQNDRSIKSNGLKPNMTLRLLTAQLPGGSESKQMCYYGPYEMMRARLIQNLEPWKNKTLDEVKRIHSLATQKAAIPSQYLIEETLVSEGEVFELLVSKLVHENREEVAEFIKMNEGDQCLEAFINCLTLYNAFMCFIALSPRHDSKKMMLSLDETKLNQDNRTLLRYFMSISANGMKLANKFYEKMQDLQSLNGFEEDLAAEFNKDPEMFNMTDSLWFKKNLFLKLIKKKDVLLRSFSIRRMQMLDQVDTLSLGLIDLKKWNYSDPDGRKKNPKNFQCILFQLISTLSRDDLDALGVAQHSDRRSLLKDPKWQMAYQAWKTVAEATGTKMHRTLDFLNKDATSQTVPPLDDPFVSEDHRLLRHIDLEMPMILLDEIQQLAKKDKKRIIRIETIHADLNICMNLHKDDQDKDSVPSRSNFFSRLVVKTIDLYQGKDESKALQPLYFGGLPVRFKDDTDANMSSYLFEGDDGDIFWFTMKFGYLTLCLLEINATEVQEVCDIFRDCPLYEHMIENRFRKVTSSTGQEEKFYIFQTAVPRMFTLDGDRRFIAFSHHQKDAPYVLIFDVSQKKVTTVVKNAEMFLKSFRKIYDMEHILMFKESNFNDPDKIVTDQSQPVSPLLVGSQVTLEPGQPGNFLRSLTSGPTAGAKEGKGPKLEEIKSLKEVKEETSKAIKARSANDLQIKVLIFKIEPLHPLQDGSLIQRPARSVQTYDLNELVSILSLTREQSTSGVNKKFRLKERYQLDALDPKKRATRVIMFIDPNKDGNPGPLATIVKFASANYDKEKIHRFAIWQDIKEDNMAFYEVGDKVQLQQIEKKQVDSNLLQLLTYKKLEEVENEWRVCIDHPIALIYDQKNPNYFYVQSLMEKDKIRALITFQNSKILTVDQLESRQQTSQASFAMIVHKRLQDKVSSLVFTLDKPFEKGAILNEDNWKVQEIQTNLNNRYRTANYSKYVFISIQEEKKVANSIQGKVIFGGQQAQQNKASTRYKSSILSANDELTEFQLINEKVSKSVICDRSRGDEACDQCEMCKVIPVRNNHGSVYFVKKLNRTQEHLVVQINFIVNETSTEPVISTVYKTAAKILYLQLIRADQQENIYEYKYSGEIDTKSKLKDRLYVITSDLCVSIIEQAEAKKRFRLQKFDKIIKVRSPFEQVKYDESLYKHLCISHWAVVIRDKVYSRETGQRFAVFDNAYQNEATMIVPQSDYLMTWQSKDQDGSEKAKSYTLVFENDPGRRNHSLVGSRHLRNILSLHVLSRCLFLVRFGTKIEESYWSLLNIDGTIVQMDPKLAERLHHRQNPDCYWTHVQTCHINSTNCRVLLFSDQQAVAEVLEVTAEGDLLHSFRPTVESDPDCKRQMVIMNRHGQLLHWWCKEEAREVATVQNITLLETMDYSCNMRRISFERIPQNQEFVFTGDFLCWKADYAKAKQNKVYYISLSQNEEQAAPRQIDIIGEINVSNYLRLQKLAGEGSISCWQPVLAAKASQTGLLNKKNLKVMGDRLQVTVRDRIKVFELKRTTENQLEANLVGEMNGTEMLLDPDEFVQTNYECATTIERVDTNGKKSICLRQSLKLTWSGTIVLHCQSVGFSPEFSKDESTKHRRILGVYKSFSRVDFLELERVKKLSSDKRTPKRIILGAINASFGDRSLFTELCGKDTQTNKDRQQDPHILQKIFEDLQEQDFEEQEDVYGQNQTHPTLRRLSDALNRNLTVMMEHVKANTNIEVMAVNNLPMQTKGENNQAIGMAITDKLIQLGRLSPEFNIFESIGSQDEFDIFLQQCTPNVIAALNNSRFEPTTSKRIDKLAWPNKRIHCCGKMKKEKSILTFETKHIDVAKKDFEINYPEGSFECEQIPVEVHMINMDWFNRNGKNFIDFARCLEGKPDDVFKSEMVTYTLEHFWPEFKEKIIARRVLPQVALTLLQIASSFVSLSHFELSKNYEENSLLIYASNSLNLCFVAGGIVIELYSCKGQESCAKYMNWWNFFDIISLTCSSILTLAILTKAVETTEHLRLLAAIAIFFEILKLFDWLRLFDNTAFYVALIMSAISDIKSFVIITVIAMFLFGIPMEVIAMPQDDDAQIRQMSSISDIFYKEYMLSLGEFAAVAEFEGDTAWIWLNKYLFIFTTFLINITILNVLIAIMMETFTRINQNKMIFSNKMKMQFISESEYSLLPIRFKYEKDSSFKLFIALPAFQIEFESDRVLSMVSGLKQTSSKVQAMLKTYNAQFDEVKDEIKTMKKSVKQDFDNQMNEIRLNMASLEQANKQMQNEQKDIKEQVTRGFEKLQDRLDALQVSSAKSSYSCG